jgi:hypothetical protein
MRFGERKEFKDIARRVIDVAERPLRELPRVFRTLPPDAELTFRIATNTATLFDVPASDGQTIVDTFLKRRSQNLSSGERSYLERMGASRFTIYTILAAQIGEGMRLRDLIDGTEIDVDEPTLSIESAIGQTFACRTIQGPGDRPELDGAVIHIERSDGKSLRKRLVSLKTDWERGLEIVRTWVAIQARSLPGDLPPRIDGSIEVDVQIYDVLDARALRNALDHHDDIYEDPDDEYTWFEGEDVLALLYPNSERFEVVATPENAKLVRPMIEALALRAIRYRITTTDVFQSGETLRGPSPPFEIPEETKRDIAAAAIANHYRDWLDIPVSALDDHTPRLAAQSTNLAPHVRALLEVFQADESRSPLVPGHPYDFGWMYDELGLEKP